MELFSGLIYMKELWFLILCILGVLAVGYALGRITIKGVSLGDAGVFIVALLFGALCFEPLSHMMANKGGDAFIDQTLSICESLGLVFFVTSVGFIAGPKFFGNLKKNFKSYALLGFVIILAGALAAIGCIMIGQQIGYGATIEDSKGFTAMIVGLLSGSLTSTPAFGAAKETIAMFETAETNYTSLVTVGHGISYIFGVLGVVLFVQIVPKLVKANMPEERAKLEAASAVKAKEMPKNLFKLDGHGFGVFSLVALIGIFVGAIQIPLSGNGFEGVCFSLTATGGCLMTALVFGHFGRIGKLSVMPDEHTLKLFRELGLVLFLCGAGVSGGADFVKNFDPMYFVYGMIMTVVPMLIGFFFAKYVLKLSLLNNLGSMTGGMTSTPALGTLIGVSGTESVAAAYAATYPIALIAVVLVSQFLIILF